MGKGEKDCTILKDKSQWWSEAKREICQRKPISCLFCLASATSKLKGPDQFSPRQEGRGSACLAGLKRPSKYKAFLSPGSLSHFPGGLSAQPGDPCVISTLLPNDTGSTERKLQGHCERTASENPLACQWPLSQESNWMLVELVFNCQHSCAVKIILSSFSKSDT